MEWLWAAQFSILSYAASRGRRRLVADGRTRVLVVAPHPDDEAVGCAGAMLLHKQAGDRIAIVHMTDGRASRSLGLTTEEMARRRRGEANASAAALGVDLMKWVGLPEGSWSIAQAVPALAAILAELDPEVIYAPSRIDFHPEHFRVAHALALALDETADTTGAKVRSRLVRVYQIQVPLTPTLCNLVADVGPMSATIAAALRTYATQAVSVHFSKRLRRYTAALHGIAGQAEGFWEMPAERYCALHREPPEVWPQRAFRGLRPRPFTDPIAFVQGAGERRRLAKLGRMAGDGRRPD